MFRPGSTTAISFVFLHGGPGFNSFAERAILGPLFAGANLQVVFWNEPFRLRPDGEPFHAEMAFEHWLASARRCVMAASAPAPVHLIAHSCTIHPAVAIARDHPECVRSLILVAPSADNLTTFRNVLRLAHADLVGKARARRDGRRLARANTSIDGRGDAGRTAGSRQRRPVVHALLRERGSPASDARDVVACAHRWAITPHTRSGRVVDRVVDWTTSLDAPHCGAPCADV